MLPEIQTLIQSLNLGGRVLEVGSRDINGTIRKYLRKDAKYLGIDRCKGPNVDRIMSGHDLKLRNGYYDTVLCLDTLEHDEKFWLTLKEMRRVLKKGGTMVITVPGIGFPFHEHPKDYYRFTVDSVRLMFDGMRKVRVWAVGDYAWSPEGIVIENGRAAVFGHGVK